MTTFSLLVPARDKAEAHQMINHHNRLSLAEIYLDRDAEKKKAETHLVITAPLQANVGPQS